MKEMNEGAESPSPAGPVGKGIRLLESITKQIPGFLPAYLLLAMQSSNRYSTLRNARIKGILCYLLFKSYLMRPSAIFLLCRFHISQVHRDAEMERS